MFSDSFIQALSGPWLVKLALCIIFGSACLVLRRKETEGVFTRLAVLALFLVLRDILCLFFPLVELYRASDLLLFGLLVFLLMSSTLDWPLVAALAADIAALLLLIVRDLFSLAPGFPTEILRAVAIVPIIAMVFAPRASEGTSAPGRILINRNRLPLALASFIYLLAGAVIGVDSVWFSALVVPLFYGFFVWLCFSYTGIVESQLIAAVDYYEESVDSLYELLLPSEEAKIGSAGMQDALDNMDRVVAERTGADGSAILLVEEFEEAITVRSIHGSFAPPFKLPESLPREAERVSAYLRHARFKLGEGLLGEVASSGKPLFVADAALDARIPRNGDEDWLLFSSIIAVPLMVRDRIIGVLALERKEGATFNESDFDRAKLLSSFGSIAVANSFSFLEAAEKSDIEREASIAEGIQKTLLPKKLPPIRGFTFGAVTKTARGVCSDYYDIIQTKPDHAILVVGDIAGKGVAAGIVMVMVSSILHLITNSTKDMATLMAWVNRGIAGQVDLDHFATLALVSLDAGSGALEFSNASHQALLVYRKDSDAVETVDLKSIPIGVEKSTAYAAKKVKLASGDILFMYTDGLVEAMNDQGKQFGRKNLATALYRNRDLPAQEMADAIIEEVADFSGHSRQHDDETVLVMKAKL
jgi:sigma-B regulation protein RsbU (phosphoserine phosphatase)